MLLKLDVIDTQPSGYWIATLGTILMHSSFDIIINYHPSIYDATAIPRCTRDIIAKTFPHLDPKKILIGTKTIEVKDFAERLDDMHLYTVALRYRAKMIKDQKE